MESVYWIVPASPKTMWFLAPIVLLLAALIVLMVVIGYGSQRSSFELTGDALRLRGDLWGRTIPLDSLDIGAARIVDLRNEPSLHPTARRAGTGLPGFSAGWFRLRNGQKALLYLTDRTRVLYVPTSAGYSLLLSPERPDAMLADLRSRATR